MSTFNVKNKNKRPSQYSIGYLGLIYDSVLEAKVSEVLGDKVLYRGGNPYDTKVLLGGKLVDRPANQYFKKLVVQYQGKTWHTIPDFQIKGAKGCYIEAKGNLDKRSRLNIAGMLNVGRCIGVVFISEAAALQPLWPGCQVSKAQWLQNRGVPFVCDPSEAGTLIELVKQKQEVL